MQFFSPSNFADTNILIGCNDDIEASRFGSLEKFAVAYAFPAPFIDHLDLMLS
jgi:hypothetical protein